MEAKLPAPVVVAATADVEVEEAVEDGVVCAAAREARTPQMQRRVATGNEAIDDGAMASVFMGEERGTIDLWLEPGLCSCYRSGSGSGKKLGAVAGDRRRAPDCWQGYGALMIPNWDSYGIHMNEGTEV